MYKERKIENIITFGWIRLQMSIIYPRPPEECPVYYETNDQTWFDEVRLANNFGVKKEYNVGDEVETISFYFPKSEAHQKNEVVIESGTIESIFKFESGNLSYDVALANGSTKITSFHRLRLNVSI